jgi:hypothetical protein
VVFSTGVLPLFGSSPMRRLGYVPLGYAAMCMLTNSIWDRFVWMGVALAVLAAVDRSDEDLDHPPERQDDMASDTPGVLPVGATA